MVVVVMDTKASITKQDKLSQFQSTAGVVCPTSAHKPRGGHAGRRPCSTLNTCNTSTSTLGPLTCFLLTPNHRRDNGFA